MTEYHYLQNTILISACQTFKRTSVWTGCHSM